MGSGPTKDMGDKKCVQDLAGEFLVRLCIR